MGDMATAELCCDTVTPIKTKLASPLSGFNKLSLRGKMGDVSGLPDTDSKFFNLTQTLMRDKMNNLPKYGLFASLIQRMQPMFDKRTSPVENTWTHIIRMKRATLKTQISFRHNPRMQRDMWSHIRRESQLPDCEQNPDRFTLEEAGEEQSVEAVKQARTKISNSLKLPVGNLARITRLRQNVQLIEQKFKSYLRTRQKLSARPTQGARGVLLETDRTFKYKASRFTEPGQALLLFQRYARIVIIVRQWISLIKETNGQHNWDQELRSFIDMTMEIEQGSQSKAVDNSGLEFDKNNFKANKEISLSHEVRFILSLPPEIRTADMLKQVLHGLQTLQSLSEYPLRTQKKLCKVACYQRVDSKKAIIREGHHPECFYFILSGICFVKRLTPDPRTGNIQNVCIARLSKGQSFGEMGLVFNTVRTATVESVTPMELLVIRREDFLTIFMNAENPEEDADHIRFMREIPVFKTFPIDVLKKEPGMCLLNYFKRGSVIVENSQCTDWLYIIKSGTCEIIQRLHAVRPRLPRRSAKHKLPNLDIDDKRSRANSTISSKTSKDTLRSELISLTSNSKKEMNSKTNFQLPKITVDCKLDDNEIKLKLPPMSSAFKQDFSGISLSSSGQNNWTERHLSTSWDGETSERSMTSGSDRTPTPNSKQGKPSEVFIQVGLLQTSDIFGLQSIQWDGEEMAVENDEPHLSLVSRGAEIILLSKKVFLKYANDQVKITAKILSRPYPNAETMQKNLQTQVNWDLYRETVLAEYLKNNKLSRRRIPKVDL